MPTRKKSPVSSFEKLSPNRNKPRTGPVRRLTPHHAGGNCTAETILGLSNFQTYNPTNGTSANYATGSDGRTGLGVEETNRAWTSSSYINDQEAITIELSNNGGAPDWHMSSKTINSFLDQSVETAKFYGFKKINYVEKPDNVMPAQVEAWIKTWAKDDEMIITLHNWFKATICPGPYFTRQLPWLVREMNKRLGDSKYKVEAFVGEGGTATGQPIPVPSEPVKIPKSQTLKPIYVVAKEVISGSWGNGQDRIKKLTAAGYDSKAVQAEVNKLTAAQPVPFKNYEILITVSSLNIRKGPAITQPKVRTLLNDKYTYTIVEEKDGPSDISDKTKTGKWGKLKSGEGWILLDFTKRK